jgi:GNAT domain-containint protein/N-acyltransferase family protein
MMQPSDVAARLRLGADYSQWLQMLEQIGPPANGLPEPSPEDLDTVHIEPTDRSDVLVAAQDLYDSPEWRWLLERAYHSVQMDVGDAEGMRPMPNLPVDRGTPARCFWIVVLLCAVRDIRAWHRAQAVPDDISRDTLADLGRHTRLYYQRNKHVGLDTQWWISLAFRGGLFGIGRLQYAPYHLLTGPAGPLFWYDDAAAGARGHGFQRGDPVLGLHIPDSGPLTPSVCVDSFQRAQTFFRDHFREYADAVVTCTSWLLDEQLQQYLEPDSNIVLFQRRFELIPGTRDSDASAFHFVFGSTPDAIDQLQPRTRLERAVVQHVRDGGHWRMRTGWLRLADQA